jgi:uncharacterized membrane protein
MTEGGAERDGAADLEKRVERLERSLNDIASELAALRAASAQSAPPFPPSPPLPLPPGIRERRGLPLPRASSEDIEGFLGRYGMLVIAAVAAVAAVGTFLSWAITHGYIVIGPAARLALGLVAAGAVGAWGLRLRRRERSFGSTLLGLALAIVLVCAYAAGPGLHVVPSPAAFAGAAVVSWALAAFAHGENDEPLWCAAFAGAAVAPFVTSDGRGSEFALLGYGALISVPGCFAIGAREWRIAWRVLYAVAALYTLAAAGIANASAMPQFIGAVAFPVVVAAGGVAPFAPLTRQRGLLRWLAALALLATLGNGPDTVSQRELVSAIVLTALAAWMILLDARAAAPQSSIVRHVDSDPVTFDWIDAAALPLLYALRAANAIMFTNGVWPAFAIASAISLVFTWRRAVGSLRDAAAFAVAGTATLAAVTVPVEQPVGRIATCIALTLALIALHRVRPSRTWVACGGVLLVGTALRAAIVLIDRPAYQFTPFATEESGAALIVLAAFAALARAWPLLRSATRDSLAGRPEWTYAGELRLLLRMVTSAPWTWAFVWVMIELAMAYSQSTSTLLLVVYFAVTAVASVAVGRMRRRARLRRIGLALALLAAATAYYGASSYFDFAARIAAYLVTSVFLLGIAYWYRRQSEESAAGV